MFFLATYGTLNLVSGMSALVSSPSYRPTFKVHWLPSLVGGFGCVFAMFLLSPLATIASAVVIFGLYSFLKRRRYQTAWGDERSGIWFALARLGLLQLSASREHVRNWRPVLLVLVGNPKSRMHLVQLATRLEASRGMIFLAQVVAGDWKKLVARQEALQESLRDFIRETRLAAVGKVVLADNFEHGVSTLLQVSGIGPLQPNTVLIGWSEDQLKRASFIQTVRRILELKRSLLVYAEAELPESQLEPVIDVWWRARINGGFMLTLAHLLRESSGAGLRDHRIRVRRIVESEQAVEEAREALEKLVRETRFDAEVEIVASSESPLATIATASARSSHCFVGLGFSEAEAHDDPLADYAPVVDSLKGQILLCRSWHDLHPEEDQDQPAR
jgi:hypothetical protein